MTIEALTFLPALSMPALMSIDAANVAGASNVAVPSAPSGQFAAWFTEQLSQTNVQLLTADRGIQQLAAGDASNLHQVMINLEQAKLSMQLVMQVRNHLLDGYHELMQMQI